MLPFVLFVFAARTGVSCVCLLILSRPRIYFFVDVTPLVLLIALGDKSSCGEILGSGISLVRREKSPS